MISRRNVLKLGGTTAAALAGGFVLPSLPARADETITLPFANGERPLVKYPGKRALIRLTERPPQLETPFGVFNEGILTPNDAFFVRYHLSDIPLEIDPQAYRIEVKGLVKTPLSLSLGDLRSYEPVELVAAHQCSGNSRGFIEPRVAGGQLANGAMGNAKWKGVPLRAILDKAGVQPGAVQVSFGGLDGPAAPDTPDFVKALDIDHARDGEVMVAYAMNGEDLPWLNGFPVRLVVPGWYGTYWLKHLNEITVLDKPFEGFWMKSAYRIPDNDCACTEPGKAPDKTVPINRFNVRSFITSVLDGEKVSAGVPIKLRGFAFDGGSGIKQVSVSTDGGATWLPTRLGEDLGKYSFREWTADIKLDKGSHVLKVRAIGNDGKAQPDKPLWNPAGYMRNCVEATKVTAA
ncbi:molybdopterin-dependent oxidoreductase [Labrys sp. KNU-23]|uniref:SorA family sulfite dehydrogenase catalytic subunit n=1 Tax=Labrys sp. KNU-23 TaxID=2789216 RepID=UPI0011EDF00D|nr:molybdopterin-dependent oxidoreductase [Labrys sp. KNU-23]QEN85593.1 molybdopterin-dependent oxidoreductase [Labrys sp. KNU-23]